MELLATGLPDPVVRPCTTTKVFGACHRIEVDGVHAVPHSAQVIKIKFSWITNVEFVKGPMGQRCFQSGTSETPIAVGVQPSLPQPTSCFIDHEVVIPGTAFHGCSVREVR